MCGTQGFSSKRVKTLGVVAETPICLYAGRIFVHASFGRIIDRLDKEYEHVWLCTPTFVSLDEFHASGRVSDFKLHKDSIRVIPQPNWSSLSAALKHPVAIIQAYSEILRKAEHIFVRGMIPFVGFFYLLCYYYGRRPVHWIVGNPIALLRSHRRSTQWKDFIGLVYSYKDYYITKMGRALTGGTFICNGEELTRAYASPNTLTVVSSTITDEEFFYRDDTCRGNIIKLLFVGFVRPEKGLEFLIEALAILISERAWNLTIVGSWEGKYQEYKNKIDNHINALGLRDRVTWEGYISHGPELLKFFRKHDIFVFPTLSEGTPRVLIEARANGLPIVSTNVGGIPTSVSDGVDGILVPPKDPAAFAKAIDRVIKDGELRRNLIYNGYRAAQSMTVGRFSEKFADVLKGDI
jgi:glycosyltransferase involved in cell wall biosynthesis